MTDEQIIKNAEHHKLGNCSQCDYKNYGSNCLHELLNDSIKMAKRLCDDVADFEEARAEIKELKDILEKVPTNAYDLQVEASEKLENQIKSEAIKVFTKRLKSKLNDLEFRTKTNRKTVPTKFCDDNVNWVLHECVPEEIDKLIKEMTKGE